MFGSPLWSISRTSPRSMMLRWISGSTTSSNALRISSSVAMSSILREPDQQVVAFDAHGVALHRRDRRERERRTGADAEPRAVARADHDVVVDLAFGQRPAVVRADVLDRVIAVVQAVDRDVAVVHLERLGAPGGNVRDLPHFHEPGRLLRRSSASSRHPWMP